MTTPAHITGVRSHDTLRRASTSGTQKVPNAKKPRSRPPIGLRDYLPFSIHGVLPGYSGPYSVGVMEFEIPVENPRTFSSITRQGHHLLRLETVLFTLYYPASFGAGTGKDPSGRKKWSRETWLPRPRKELAAGYGRFSGMGGFAIPWFAATSMATKLPAFRNAPPATHWPPASNTKNGGHKVKNQQGPVPDGEPDEPVFPLLFFSHGLGGSRTAYSSMCGEFASYGFVVCALEHRDGSGPRTFVNHFKEGEGSMEEREKNGGFQHSEQEKKQGYDVIDYIFPKENPYDTSPLNEKGIDAELRTAQIELRMEEIREAYMVLCEIRDGKGDEVAQRNLRRKGYIGSSSRGLEGISWSQWKNRFHCERVTVAGHSFGAATVIEILRRADVFANVEQGIIYDIWGAPIKPPADDPLHRIHRPLLAINSEAFDFWPSNFDAVKSLMNEAKNQGAPAWLVTVRGTIHISQSDFTILYPHICSFFLKMTANPRRAVDLNISLSLEFLRDVMGEQGGGKSLIRRSMTDEGLLRTVPIDVIPDEHKPEDKWIAARLKIPHEFRTRLMAKAQREVKRKKNAGLYQPEDEVWMHVNTSEEDVATFRARRRSEKRDHDRKNEATYELRTKTADAGSKSKSEGTRRETETSNSGEVTSTQANGTWLGMPPSWGDAESEPTEENIYKT